MLMQASLLSAENKDIEQTIKENIDQRTARRLHHVAVHLNGNQVTIHGEAHSYYIRQLALASVLDTLNKCGPMQIVDEIRVRKLPQMEAGYSLDE